MYKVVKFDCDKLKKGTEVFDIVLGWIEVTKLNFSIEQYTTTHYITTTHGNYNEEGKEYFGDRNPRLVAMRIPIDIESIPTKEFVMKEENFSVKLYDKNKWKVCEYHLTKFYGAKYYTKENAQLVVNILNEKEEE